VLGKPLGFYERFIANRFFRKHGTNVPISARGTLYSYAGLREVEAHTSAQCHDRIYAGMGTVELYVRPTFSCAKRLQTTESIAHMNEAARGDQLRQVHLLPVACAHGSAEVSQLEINRAVSRTIQAPTFYCVACKLPTRAHAFVHAALSFHRKCCKGCATGAHVFLKFLALQWGCPRTDTQRRCQHCFRNVSWTLQLTWRCLRIAVAVSYKFRPVDSEIISTSTMLIE
jgi:hypothetical protein